MSSASAALWKRAHDSLKDKDRAILDKNLTSTPDQLQAEIQAQITQSKGGPIKLPNGEQFFVRDVLGTISRWVKMFVEVGDTVVQYDPGHAALPWAALRALLKATTNNQDKHAAVLEGVERISFYMTWSRLEAVYLGDPFQAPPDLEIAFVKLYSSILRFAARSFRFLESKMGRLLGAFASSDSKFRRDLAEMADHQRDIKTHTRQLAEGLTRGIPEKILQLRNDLEQPIARIEDTVQYVQDTLDRNEKDAILDWASQVPFLKHYKTANQKAMHGTGSWLLEDDRFVDWRTSSRSQMLWLLGGAGTGKSTLASIFLQSLMELYEGQRTPYPVFFFCSRNVAEPERAKPEAVLRCLVRQVSDLPGGPPLHQNLKKRYEQRRVAGEISSAEASEIIMETIRERPLTYVIVDALDECDPETRDVLIDALKDIVSQSHSLVKVFVTSRTSHADIRNAMDGLPVLYIDASRNQEDIQRFVVSEVDNAIKKKKLLRTENVSAELRRQIIDSLCNGASGMFRWVELQLKFLYTIRSQSFLLERLGRLPPNLEKSYQELYDHEMQDLGDQSGVTRRILSLLLISKRPLTIAETCELACASETHGMNPETVVEFCFDLVALDTELDRFRFAHLSVREFLEKRDEYSPGRTHGIATNSCLQSMAKHKHFSLSRYDALYWAFHAEDAAENGGGKIIKAELDSFLLGESLLDQWSHQLQQDIAERRSWERTPVEVRIFACLKNNRINKSETALLIATCFGLMEQSEQLISVISQPEEKRENDKVLRDALRLSCRYNKSHMASFFLKHGVDVNSCDKNDRPPLSIAAQEGHIAIVELLLAQDNVDVNVRNYGRTPLSYAAENGHIAIVELLLAYDNVNVTLANEYGQSPLSYAAENGHITIVELLLAQDNVDVDLCNNDGRSLLSIAADRGHNAIVELLLTNSNVNVNFRDKNGSSPLSDAAGNGHNAIVELLLAQKNIDVNLYDNYGQSPLLYAARKGHNAIVELLLAHKNIDVNLCDNYGRSPLFYAARNGHNAIIKLLLARNNVNVNLCDKNGHSPLSDAAKNGHNAIVELLLVRHGVDVNVLDNQQWSALHWAAYFGKTEVIDTLLVHGADCNVRDWQGWSPYDVAAFAGYDIPALRIEGTLTSAVILPVKGLGESCKGCNRELIQYRHHCLNCDRGGWSYNLCFRCVRDAASIHRPDHEFTTDSERLFTTFEGLHYQSEHLSLKHSTDLCSYFPYKTFQ